MDLFVDSLICLCGVELNQLRTGTGAPEKTEQVLTGVAICASHNMLPEGYL